MNSQLTEQLYNDFPNLFQRSELRCSMKVFGFECGDGWHSLIRKLCEELDALTEDIQITQIKEKFGELRVYVDAASKEAYQIIDKYQDRSQYTCEACGQNGHIDYDKRWLECRCNNCRKR